MAPPSRERPWAPARDHRPATRCTTKDASLHHQRERGCVCVCVCVCVCEHDQNFSLLTFSFSIINIIVFNIFQTNQTMAGACRGTAGRVHRRTVLCVWAVRKQQLYSMSFFFTAPLSPTIFFPAENNLYTSGGMLYIVTYSAIVYRFYLYNNTLAW